jgi:hypothetical protein
LLFERGDSLVVWRNVADISNPAPLRDLGCRDIDAGLNLLTFKPGGRAGSL